MTEENKIEEIKGEVLEILPGLIYQKIFNVMSDVEYMPKDGKVDFGKTKYEYLSAERIVENCRKEIIKQELIIWPIKCTTENTAGSEKDITATYRILAIEDGSFIDAQVTGGGHDSTDKKSYKAMTGAYKYALRQTFMIETGTDDPDRQGKDKGKPTGNKSQKPVTEPQLKRYYAMVKQAGLGVNDMDELVKRKYKIEHKDQMTMAQIDEVFKYLEDQIAEKKVADDFNKKHPEGEE